MKPLFCTTIVPCFLLFSFCSNATPAAPFPLLNKDLLIHAIKAEPIEKTNVKICACQVLHVRSNNENFQNVVLFAERTNDVSVGNLKKPTLGILQKEKKKMKAFYSQITVKRQMVVPTDCATLYKRLQKTYENLQVFQTFDADIRLALK